ncbi:MAG: MucR family transcriptional regulator [Blastococcus sp.]
MLHPVGNLPTAVYWRRRLVVLVVLLALLGGAAYLGYYLVSRNGSGATATAAATTRPSGTPALEQVVPSMRSLRTPSALPTTKAVPAPAPTSAAPTPGGPCTDAMLSVTVRAPASAAVGSKPTFTLVVTNTAAVPCVRALDKGLQELVLVDSSGHRVWGSNDCFPESSSDTRTLAPHATVTFPVIWGGLTSEPTCTAARVRPKPGAYALHGRLATKASANVPFRLV